MHGVNENGSCHLFLPASEPHATVPGRWVDAGDLQVGDVLLLMQDRQSQVETIDRRQVASKVYNFQVADLHTYAVGAGGVLVHNNAPCLQTGKLHDVGLAKDLRKGAIPGTEVHHAPGTAAASSLVGDHQEAAKLLTGKKLGNAGSEPAIRLSKAEHDAVSAAQRTLGA
ncbi:MAG TPA: polymorphic toxin-type HINT domain-containing protein, partial [Pirellulales bacterium]|nr:polymorphic toxin-type HINT domain-containing protein [Pirellulales bacterium]